GWWVTPPYQCCLDGPADNAVKINSVAATSRGELTADVYVILTDHGLYRWAYDYYASGWAALQPVDYWGPSYLGYTNIAATARRPFSPPQPPPPPPPECVGGDQMSLPP